VEVSALGAILYELLTGRPPFRGATAAETVQQLIDQDPVAPSRSNPRVPRDLETVCLKCLHKDPRSRYPSAAALEEDLHRFLRGEAVAARPEGWARRLVRRVRRRKLLSAALAACALLAAALVGVAVWYVAEQAAVKRAADAELAAMERAASEDLRDMARQLQTSRWPEATTAWERAKARLGDRGSDELHRFLEQGSRDLRLASRLDAIRLAGAESVGGSLALYHTSDRQYEEAFRDARLGQVHDDPAVVAGRIRASNVHHALVAALDDWSGCASDPRREEWVLSVARMADRDPTGWRDRARDPRVRKDPTAFARVIEGTRFEDQSVPLLLALELVMRARGNETIGFLMRVQQAHPGDFWANFRLGDILRLRRAYPTAVRYLQAARAIRPKAAIVCNNLGLTLSHLGQKEAIDQFRTAVHLDPTAALGYHNLAISLLRLGEPDKAIEELRAGLRVCPRTARLHDTLGTCLEAKGRYAEAVAQHRQAVALDPKDSAIQGGLRAILLRRGRAEEARAAWQAALALDPPEHDDWYGYAELCLFLGQKDEYRRARLALLSRFGTTTVPYLAERVSRACLLLPAAGDELRQAVALAERAASVDRSRDAALYPHFQFVRGLAEYRQGRFKAAIATMRGEASRVLGPAPGLVLAMALHKSRQGAEARKALRAAVVGHDWSAANVRDQDGWIYHVLRREAEGMILPDLPAFLEGKYQPKDNDERLALIGVCQFSNRTLALARLYRDAFTADPRLENNLRDAHRYNAACAAAQAGCGRGADTAGLQEAEQARWRKQALEWLQADLAARVEWFDGNPAARRGVVGQTLGAWRQDADLACVRDPAELKKLALGERKKFLAFWADVAAVLAHAEK
jgi:serine/threonine-protein kinase